MSFDIENIKFQIHSLIITYKATTILLYQLYNPDMIERVRGIRELGIFVGLRRGEGGKCWVRCFPLNLQYKMAWENDYDF
jgi:hypothetical protein